MTAGGEVPQAAAAALWLGAGAVALLINGVAVREGMAAYAARSAAMATPPPETRLAAPPRILAGEAQAAAVSIAPATVEPARPPADRLTAAAQDTARPAAPAERLAPGAEAERLAAGRTEPPLAATSAAVATADRADTVAPVAASGADRASADAAAAATADRVDAVAPVAASGADRASADAARPTAPVAAAPAIAAAPRVGGVAPVSAAPPSAGLRPPPSVVEVAGPTRLGVIAVPAPSTTAVEALRPATPDAPTPTATATTTAPPAIAAAAAPPATATATTATSTATTATAAVTTATATTTTAARVTAVAPAASGVQAASPAASTAARVASVAVPAPPALPRGAERLAAAAPAPEAPLRPVTPPPPEPRADQPGIAAPDADLPPPETTYRDVLTLLAETPAPPCFAALPTLSEDGEFQLEVFAQSEADLAIFAARLTETLGQVPNATLKPVSPAQCAAIDALRASPAYPAFTIYFDLASRDIASGTALEGRIGNTGGGILSFLVIDDEGTVQDLFTFLKFTAGEARFSVPLSLTDGPVATRQLLMALSTPALPRTVLDMNGAAAADFFAALATEFSARAMRADMSLVAFSVR
ncbi:MAG: hypothetical protein ACK4GO_06445 [Gemmobacter sp.]